MHGKGLVGHGVLSSSPSQTHKILQGMFPPAPPRADGDASHVPVATLIVPKAPLTLLPSDTSSFLLSLWIYQQRSLPWGTFSQRAQLPFPKAWDSLSFLLPGPGPGTPTHRAWNGMGGVGWDVGAEIWSQTRTLPSS